MLAPPAAGFARRTTSAPGGKCATRGRIAARSRRFTRFRTTADPTARETTRPTSTGFCSPKD